MPEPSWQERVGAAVGDAGDALQVRLADGVATVELHRPERRNAVTYAMWQALARLVPVLGADDAVDVVVLRGTPGGPFSAGADISEFGTLRATPAQAATYGRAVEAAERALLDLRRPSVAVVEGWAVGGGTQLALACDLRVCDAAARFGVPPANLGVVYPLASTARLADVVGQAWAAWFLLTGELVDAATALRVGLVHEVCEPGGLEQRAAELTLRLATRARVSQEGAKALLARAAAGHREDDAQTLAAYDRSLTGPEYAEGVAAFLGKRPPDFRGVR